MIRAYEKDMLGNVCFSKSTNNFDFALVYQGLRFELFF